MQHHVWGNIPVERLKGGLTRQVIHTTNMTIARLTLARGATVPRHSHVNEQVTTIESGRLRFVFDGGDLIAGQGESVEIPPNAAHAVHAMEDTVALDVFAPAREDWKRGDDAYLREDR